MDVSFRVPPLLTHLEAVLLPAEDPVPVETPVFVPRPAKKRENETKYAKWTGKAPYFHTEDLICGEVKSRQP